jgi:Ca2+-binding RTX toxin-like protein
MADSAIIGLSSLASVETITANGYNGVTITGDANANTLDFSLVSLIGIAQIQGGAGSDSIIGGGGNDVMAGTRATISPTAAPETISSCSPGLAMASMP